MGKVGFIEALQANKTKRVRRFCPRTKVPYEWQNVGEFQKLALGELDGVALGNEALESDYEIEEQVFVVDTLTKDDIGFIKDRCKDYIAKKWGSSDLDASEKIEHAKKIIEKLSCVFLAKES